MSSNLGCQTWLADRNYAFRCNSVIRGIPIKGRSHIRNLCTISVGRNTGSDRTKSLSESLWSNLWNSVGACIVTSKYPNMPRRTYLTPDFVQIQNLQSEPSGKRGHELRAECVISNGEHGSVSNRYSNFLQILICNTRICVRIGPEHSYGHLSDGGN